MNKKLIVIVFLLWSLAYCAFGQANQWGPFDPGALRNDGSNASSAATVRDNLGLGTMAVATSTDYVATDTFTAHTSATGTAVHGLGTMAAEAATDYVATDTFTGHTGATGSSVHGLGTISTKADTDYVATSALALRLDTTNASITENLGVAGHSTLTTASATVIQLGGTALFGLDVTVPVSYAVDDAKVIATFTFDSGIGGEIEIYLHGIKSNIGAVSARKVFRVKAYGTLTITSPTIETWGDFDPDATITAVASGTTVNLILTGESPNYYALSGCVKFRSGSGSTYEIKNRVPEI